MPPNPGRPRRFGPSHATRWHLSTTEDVERALSAAERLLRQGEERRRHLQNRTFAMLSLIFGLSLSLFASLLASSLAASAATLMIGTGVLAFALRELLRLRQIAKYDRTLQLATELAAIAREAFLEVAEREHWSYVRVESTKLRLSAFPIQARSRNEYEP